MDAKYSSQVAFNYRMIILCFLMSIAGILYQVQTVGALLLLAFTLGPITWLANGTMVRVIIMLAIDPSAHRPIGPSAHRPIAPSPHRPIQHSSARYSLPTTIPTLIPPFNRPLPFCGCLNFIFSQQIAMCSLLPSTSFIYQGTGFQAATWVGFGFVSLIQPQLMWIVLCAAPLTGLIAWVPLVGGTRVQKQLRVKDEMTRSRSRSSSMEYSSELHGGVQGGGEAIGLPPEASDVRCSHAFIVSEIISEPPLTTARRRAVDVTSLTSPTDQPHHPHHQNIPGESSRPVPVCVNVWFDRSERVDLLLRRRAKSVRHV